MIFDITQEQITWTNAFFSFKSHWKKRYYSNFQSTFEGFLAEVVLCDAFGLERPRVHGIDKDEYDLLWEGLKWDLKNTSTEGKVVFVSKKQFDNQKNIDGYMFSKTDLKNKKLYLLGYLYVNEVTQYGEFVPTGQKSSEGVLVRVDDYVIKVGSLKQIKHV